jgi:hypothetical protein
MIESVTVTNHEVPHGNWGIADCTVPESPSRVDAFRVAAEQDESVARIGGNRNVRVASIVIVLHTTCLAGHASHARSVSLGRRGRSRASIVARGENENLLFGVKTWLLSGNDRTTPSVIVIYVAHLMRDVTDKLAKLEETV